MYFFLMTLHTLFSTALFSLILNIYVVKNKIGPSPTNDGDLFLREIT